MSHTVLLTLGRLPKGLDIARSFGEAGWRVMVAEPFAWHLTGLSRAVAKSHVVTAPNTNQAAYLDDLLRVIAEENVSLVVPISEETMHVAALKDRLPAGVRLFTVVQDALLPLHDKLCFARWADRLGLPVPNTAALGSEEARAIVSAGMAVVKDRSGASGSGIAFLEKDADLPQEREGALVQTQLSGEEISTFSIVHQGIISATVVYRPVIRDGTVSTVFERIENHAAEAYVARAAKACAHTGFLSFDMMVNADGDVAAFECNPRANSGIHFLETIDIARAVLEPDFRPSMNRYRVMQQAYPTLTLLWGAIGRWPRYLRIAKALFTSRDVTWSWRDPLPFALMTPATWPLLRQAMFEGRTLGKAAIHDIGWFTPQDDV